jgi:hypothetical protein
MSDADDEYYVNFWRNIRYQKHWPRETASQCFLVAASILAERSSNKPTRWRDDATYLDCAVEPLQAQTFSNGPERSLHSHEFQEIHCACTPPLQRPH